MPGATIAELALPLRHLPARFGQHQAPELADHAGVFGDRDEFRRADQRRGSG